MVKWDHRRVHACADAFDPVRSDNAFANCEQFDDIPSFAGGLNLFAGHRRDAFAVHAVDGDVCVEGERRENRHLLGGIESFDVGGWVRLGVAELLGRRKRVPHRLPHGVD